MAVVALYVLFFGLMAVLLAIMIYGVLTEGRNR